MTFGRPTISGIVGYQGWRALRHRNYRLFFGGQLTSLVGTWMMTVAQSWLVLQLTGNPFDLGVVSAVQFLPVLVLGVLAILFVQRVRSGKDERTPVLRSAETCLAIAAGLVFLFLNLAPPYGGWQLRGSWVPRLYQPVFVAMVSLVAAFFQTRAVQLPLALRRGTWAALGLVVALQAWVVFAPVLGAPRLSGEIYYRFYHHASRPFYADNLKKLGTRPVGFCG